MGKERTCNFGCAMTSISVFLYLKLPIPALGHAVLASKKKRKEGKNLSCVVGNEEGKPSIVNNRVTESVGVECECKYLDNMAACIQPPADRSLVGQTF